MAVYYPSAQVRLQMYVDDYTATEQLADKLRLAAGGFGITTPTTEIGRIDAIARTQDRNVATGRLASVSSRDEVEAQRAEIRDTRARLQTAGLSGQPVEVGKAAAFEGPSDDGSGVAFSVLPLSCTIERNGILDPSTATVTLDFRDVPIDPRILRSCLVTVTIGAVSAGDYQDGINARRVRDSDGMYTSIVERTAGEEQRFVGGQSRFVGLADEWLVNLEEGGDVVEIQCRDISAILKDQRLPDGVGIDLSKPIVDGIHELFSALDDDGKQLFPMLVDFPVYFGTPQEYAQQGVVGSSSGPVPGDSLPEVSKGRSGERSKGQRSGDKEDSVWDHIVVICQKLGLVPMVRSFVLFLAKPSTIYSQVAGGRKMVYGRNLTAVKFARKLGGVQSDTIEIRSYDPDIGRTRWARHPVLAGEPTSGILGDPDSPQPRKSRPSKVSPVGQPDETVQTFSVPRVTDLGALEDIARQTFEEVARQEVEGSFQTDDLDSFKEPGDDGGLPSYDLLALEPGDPITILVAPPLTDSASGDSFKQVEKEAKRSKTSAQELFAQTPGRRADYLKSLGISDATAQRLALAAEQIPLANTFKVSQVNLDYSIEDGVSIECSFYNYITVREEADEQPSVGESLSDTITSAVKGVG